jgi:Family of unknown function (DUF6917)
MCRPLHSDFVEAENVSDEPTQFSLSARFQYEAIRCSPPGDVALLNGQSVFAMATPKTKIATTRFVTLATYAANRPVEGKVVTVLDSTHEARGLKLISTYSRALQKNSIHELIGTDETGRKPGDTAGRIAYLAFFEVSRGGCILVGETLFVDERPVGEIVGFDETHEPNHINIVIGVKQRQTGKQLNLSVGSRIRFARQ